MFFVFGGGRHFIVCLVIHCLNNELFQRSQNNQSQSVHRPTVQHLKPDRGKKSMSESAVQIFTIWNGVNSHINRVEGNCCLAPSKNTWTETQQGFLWAQIDDNEFCRWAPGPWKSFVWIPGSSPAAELEQNGNTTASTARVVSCPAKHHLALQSKWDSSLSWPEFLTDLLLHVINHSALG